MQHSETSEGVTADERIGALAARLPGATRVLWRLDMDFWCGGQSTLAAVCAARAVPLGKVIAALDSVRRRPVPPGWSRWDRRPLGELIDHLIEHFHRPLRAELGRVSRLLDAAELAADAALRELSSTVRGLVDHLLEHLDREEQVLFPWLRRGVTRTAAEPIAVLHRDHASIAADLQQIRRLTGAFTLPEHASEALQRLWQCLEDIDLTLKEHMHLENNVLFPRALAA